jgi:hypothetical protein
VQWSRFIRIKKKDYLDEYIFIKEIGYGTYGLVVKIKMKYNEIYRAGKIIKLSIFN